MPTNPLLTLSLCIGKLDSGYAKNCSECSALWCTKQPLNQICVRWRRMPNRGFWSTRNHRGLGSSDPILLGCLASSRPTPRGQPSFSFHLALIFRYHSENFLFLNMDHKSQSFSESDSQPSSGPCYHTIPFEFNHYYLRLNTPEQILLVILLRKGHCLFQLPCIPFFQLYVCQIRPRRQRVCKPRTGLCLPGLRLTY